MKTIVKNALLINLLCLLFFVFSAKAQEDLSEEYEEPRKEKMEKLKAEKVAFLTEKMQLTSEEAQKFWPAYNEFQEKKQGLKKGHHGGKHKKKIEEMSDEDLIKMVDEQADKKIQISQLEKDFNETIKRLLPIKKVALYHQAEHEFKRKMIRQMKERKEKQAPKE